MFPIGDQIDPEIPTDPNELVLYKKYGKNWRDVISGRRYARDRGGNLDRGMRFMHTTPEGFMTRPTPPMSQKQMMQSDIDQSGYMSQMQKMQDDYNKMLQEWYSLTGSSAYQEQQDYYAGNYQDYYGGGSGSQDNPYSFPPATPPTGDPTPFLDPEVASRKEGYRYFEPDSLLNSTTGTSATQPYRIAPRPQQTAAAYTQMAQNNAASAPAAPASFFDRGGDRIVAKAPAPALVPASAPAVSRANPPAPTPTLNSFIQRYDRDESSPVVAPVKTVAPVKKVVKPASSFKKY